MVQRILTSIIGLVVFFSVLLSTKAVFAIAVSAIILLALYEMHKATAKGSLPLIIGIFSLGMIYWGVLAGNTLLPIILSMIVYMVASVFSYPRYSFKELYSSAFVTYYITFFFSALIRLRTEFGAEAVFLVFIFAWGTDTGAYFCGRFLGKHKLIERVSPKKTVEGAVGGVITSIVLTCIYLAILRNIFDIDYVGGAGYIGMIILSILSSVLSQLGDLAASVIKRECNVKDYGTLLPGHGGVMDRFDSVIFIAPIVLYYFVYFNKWLM